jgi:two-component system LytT family response regulator
VVAAEACNGREAVDAIRLASPDVVFLDVSMPELNGFEVLASLPADEAPLVVFVTAYDEYAVRAFEVNAVDYLLKPFDAVACTRRSTASSPRSTARAAPPGIERVPPSR